MIVSCNPVVDRPRAESIERDAACLLDILFDRIRIKRWFRHGKR